MVSINPSNILVKVKRSDQKEKRDMIGGMCLNPNLVFLTQNLQYGVAVKIGDEIKGMISNIEEGHYILFHHAVEGSLQNTKKDQQELNSQYLFDDSDPEWRYYFVPKNFLYASWDGDKITTAPDYIFATMIESEQVIEDNGSIAVINNYKESRSDVEQKLQRLQQEVKAISRHVNDVAIRNTIMEKEAEMQKLTRMLNKKKIKQFSVNYVNNIIQSLMPNPKMAWYNLVGEAPTSIYFNGQNYHILLMKHIYCLL